MDNVKEDYAAMNFTLVEASRVAEDRRFSAGPFVISLFLFVKIDLATDSSSEYDQDKKKIGFHFFLHV